MITLVRIVGESIDLVTGEQRSKALVVSNGSKELSIYIDDDTVRSIVELMVGEPTTDLAPVKKNGKHKKVLAEPILDEVESPPSMEVANIERELESEEPGNEYDDPTTGVGSL